MGTVTVATTGRKKDGFEAVRITFSALPGKEWVYAWPEAVTDLRVSALLSPQDSRTLVIDALAKGSATRNTGT